MSLRAGGEDSPEGTLAPGQHLPPGDWPGVPAVSVSTWQAEEDADGIVTGPLPALQQLAARFAEGLSAQERIGFLQATFNRGQPLAEDQIGWLLTYAAGKAARALPILAALEGFCLGMADAVVGDLVDEEAPTT